MLLKRLKTTFGWNRMICRAFAAWLSFVALVLICNIGFFDLSYMQGAISRYQFVAIVAGFFVIYSFISLLVGKWYSDSWFLLGAGSVCVAFWLLDYLGNLNFPLFSLAVIGVYAMLWVYFIRRNQKLINFLNFGKKTALVLALLVGVISCAVIAIITCLRYKTFSSPNFDFGIFCNMFYNMAKTGEPLVSCERDMILSHFAVHLSPIFYILLPFYYVFPSPLTLQIGQAVILCAGVIPVYLLCRHFKLSGRSTALISALYAFYPLLSTSCFYDIHENCFLPFFLLWTFCSFERGWFIPMYLSAACVLMVKEDAAIYLLVFALYLLLSRKSRLHGSILALISVGYFAFASYYLEKHGLGVMMHRFDNLVYNKEEGLIGVIRTALINPGFFLTQLFTTSKGTWEKVTYFVQVFLPLGFLPFCSKRPARWLLLTPVLINMLTYYQFLYQPNFQYHFAIGAFLIYATVLNVQDMQLPTRRTMFSIAIAASCCLYLTMVLTQFSIQVRWQDNQEKYAHMESILDTIDPDASVCASTFLVAHLSDREHIYDMNDHQYKADVDYVVLDTRYQKDEAERAERLWRSKGYVTYAEAKGLVLVLKFSPEALAAIEND